MNNCYEQYFAENINYLKDALESVNGDEMTALIDAGERTIRSGHKIIASGLGKNVPICDKFVGSMLSMGMEAGFLHTNSAVHGDLGMVRQGDMVIILTKSGSTVESVYLADILRKRQDVQVWLLCGKRHSPLSDALENKVIYSLEHEGDLWNILPNNSTTVNLIILQTLAMELAKRLGITLEDFKSNHPGGAIGETLRWKN